MEEERCPICLDPFSSNNTVTSVTIVTPCKHPFHMGCLQSIVRPRCPLCQKDISVFLQEECGVTSKMMGQRHDEETARIMTDQMDMLFEMIVDENEEEISVLNQMIDNWGNWFRAFYSIIIDRVYDARNYYSHISMAREGKGLFVFTYDVEDICGILHDPWYPSRASWMWAYSSNYDLCYYHMQQQQTCGMLSNLMNVYYRFQFRNQAHGLVTQVAQAPNTDFGIMIIIKDGNDNIHIKTRLMSIDEERNHQGNDDDEYIAGHHPQMRVAHRDIVYSLVTAQSHRTSHFLTSPNPDYKWARQYWRRMKKRMKTCF